MKKGKQKKQQLPGTATLIWQAALPYYTEVPIKASWE